jgi:hypothetical protein
MNVTTRVCAVALLLGAAAAALPSAQQQAPQPLPVSISGRAMNLSNTATGSNTNIQIDINNWSNGSTRDHLISTFLEKKQDGLLSELRKLPEIGRWRFPGYMGPDRENIYRLGTPVRYAMNHPQKDGGRVIVLMTDRIITFQEQRNQPRSIDYPFTLIQMQFKPNGEGEGRMAWYTQIAFDKNKQQIILENYSSEPLHLTFLKLEEKQPKK